MTSSLFYDEYKITQTLPGLYLYKCIYVLWNQLHYSTKELTKLVSNEDLKFENGGKCNFVTSSYFLSTKKFNLELYFIKVETF